MHKSIMPLAGFLLTAALGAGQAQAAPIAAPGAMNAAAGSVGLKQDVQFYWDGREYCFYPEGWHGPGWYWCGYAWEEGFGWGGPFGWHGWRFGRHFDHDRHHGGWYGGRHYGSTVGPGYTGRGGRTFGAPSGMTGMGTRAAPAPGAAPHVGRTTGMGGTTGMGATTGAGGFSAGAGAGRVGGGRSGPAPAAGGGAGAAAAGRVGRH